MSNSAIPWIVAHQAPLSMGFSRQEYWDGLPFPSPRHIDIFYCFTRGISIKITILEPQPLLLEVIPALPSCKTSFQPFFRAFAYARTRTHTHTHTHRPSKMPGSQMHSETHVHPDTQGHADTGTLAARREVDQNTLWCGCI